MNREGYSDRTAECAIGNASKSARKPEKTKCEDRFGYVFKMLRKIVSNQEKIIRLLKERG